eukprot:gnl/MRDRNA2_/MRDRNA2_63868_c0_seq1.p1 gnl/MRDRNA2_/MRDRNA2_63868_c0~~gnl/MRDRNA2_/MRDRNA2_63868_c0_seq1.p1  ORF type:complete len:371 (+),score=55.88 gnl/MRDRNA2_/MRDRNA2_63868_c0_seq1:190-1302(+)
MHIQDSSFAQSVLVADFKDFKPGISGNPRCPWRSFQSLLRSRSDSGLSPKPKPRRVGRSPKMCPREFDKLAGFGGSLKTGSIPRFSAKNRSGSALHGGNWGLPPSRMNHQHTSTYRGSLQPSRRSPVGRSFQDTAKHQVARPEYADSWPAATLQQSQDEEASLHMQRVRFRDEEASAHCVSATAAALATQEDHELGTLRSHSPLPGEIVLQAEARAGTNFQETTGLREEASISFMHDPIRCTKLLSDHEDLYLNMHATLLGEHVSKTLETSVHYPSKHLLVVASSPSLLQRSSNIQEFPREALAPEVPPASIAALADRRIDAMQKRLDQQNAASLLNSGPKDKSSKWFEQRSREIFGDRSGLSTDSPKRD